VVMKTTCRLPSLCSVLCLGMVLSVALCASAFGSPDGKTVVTHRPYHVVQEPTRVVYYVKSTASAIPIRIERLGGIPTTTIPMIVIGDPRISNH
jgi:hypothetical protein